MEGQQHTLQVSEKNAAIISDLCALRSGMSVISRKFDDICDCKTKINNVLSGLVYSYNEIARYINDLITRLNDKLDDAEKLSFIEYKIYNTKEKDNDEYDNENYNHSYDYNYSLHKNISNEIIYFYPDDEISSIKMAKDIDKSFDLLSFDRNESKKTIEKQIDSLNNKVKIIDFQIDRLKREKGDKEKYRQSLEKPAEPTIKRPSNKFADALFIFGIILLFLSSISIFEISKFEESIPYYLLPIPLIGVVFIGLAIKMMVKIKKYHSINSDYQRKLYNYNANETQFLGQIGKIDKDMELLENKKKTYEINTENGIRFLEAKFDAFEKQKSDGLMEIKTQITEIEHIAKESEAIKDGLCKSFDSVISQADWQNIDLIIFNMTSGRADTYKESLQLVDRVRQTESIIASIQYASKAICNTLYGGFNNLGSLITRSFSKLSDNIIGSIRELGYNLDSGFQRLQNSVDSVNSTNLELKERADRLIDKNNEIVNETKKLITATELGNALSEKSNETSDRLYNDLRYTSYIIKK